MSGIGAIALPAVGVGAAIGGGYVVYKQFKKWFSILHIISFIIHFSSISIIFISYLF